MLWTIKTTFFSFRNHTATATTYNVNVLSISFYMWHGHFLIHPKFNVQLLYLPWAATFLKVASSLSAVVLWLVDVVLVDTVDVSSPTSVETRSSSTPAIFTNVKSRKLQLFRNKMQWLSLSKQPYSSTTTSVFMDWTFSRCVHGGTNNTNEIKDYSVLVECVQYM